MNENEKIKELARRNAVSDASIFGLTSFLEEKCLLEEAQNYTKGFLSSISKEKWEMLIEKIIESVGNKQ